jgi:hypothetical protein
MPPVVTFHVYPNPPKGRCVGEFELSAAAWRKVRERFTPGPGVRILDYNLDYLSDG